MELDFCSSADLDGICSVEERSFSSPWPRAVIEADLTGDNPCLYLCARGGGRILGFGVLLRKGKTAGLANLAVLPEFRRRGVGSQLLAGLAEIAVSMGCSRMSLYVRQSNTGAADLYRLFGFAVLGRHKGYYAGGEDALIMEAPLPLRLPGDGGDIPPRG
ncbi:ribosomal protein S18-alanine N-acetyltransferase [Aminivibrio sp.]|uniref:ribosomal protein S18-alanine N-acetyltransferase n=1 Tax=Aminivibrio sp. TaxID=1872489 RepID=UPI001A496366|nr:ribosomal protein S18-alanine N-acetyltransferase [Aminivibrio sp.]MBL3539519.1 ribosomal protein S18-alanine N-acetyltransferase [Aminivibrio sp.]